jgi:allene oxide cyclase-like protein
MRLKLGIAAIVAALISVAGVTLASANSDSSSGTTTKLFELTVQTADIDLGDKGFSLGDMEIFSDDLYDKEGGTKVGFDGGACTIVRITDAKTFSGTAQCLVTLSLAKGQITTQGLVTFAGDGLPKPFDIAITGGTGAYQDADGQVTVEQLSETKANLTIQLGD